MMPRPKLLTTVDGGPVVASLDDESHVVDVAQDDLAMIGE
jgi:hypothetical protein